MSETAQYPTAITSQLYEAVARLSTTLTEDITADSTDIKVASTTGFPASGFIVIENETIFYDSKDADSFTVTTGRGYAGTAAAHTATTAVRYAIVAATINRIIAELTAVQQKVGISGSTYTTTVDYKLTHLPAQSVTTQVTNLNAQYLGGSTSGEFMPKSKRVYTTTSETAPAPNIDSYDLYAITALAGAATFANPTGTPANGQPLLIRIKDNGTAHGLSWSTTYRALGTTPPTTSVTSKTMYVGFMYNDIDKYWDCLALGQEE